MDLGADSYYFLQVVRISSSATVFYKVVFPAVWLSLFGTLAVFFGSLAAIGAIRGAAMPKDLVFLGILFPVACAGGLVLFFRLCFPLKHVSMSGESLLIESGSKSATVLLSEVSQVTASEWTNPEILTVTLRRSTIFGETIKFTPSQRFWRATPHPTWVDLTERVKAARTRTN